MYRPAEVSSMMDQRISCATEPRQCNVRFTRVAEWKTHGDFLFESFRLLTGVARPIEDGSPDMKRMKDALERGERGRGGNGSFEPSGV